MKNISAYESTIWSSLIVTVAASIYFFGKVFGAIAAGSPLAPGDVARMGLAVIVILVAVEVALALAFAAWCKGEPQTDERDELIAAKSARNAYYILITGLFILIGNLGVQALIGKGPWLTMDTGTTVVMLVFALVGAEVSHYLSRIVYYRVGA
ncbi:MAG: hypothetical protein KF822_12165 [Steroidobacteraceae bacterium]|nr:hypothetical protein [Steroidobacteraceae bacterium]